MNNSAVKAYKENSIKRLKNLKDSYRRAKDPNLKKKRGAQITMLERELHIKKRDRYLK